MIESLTPDKILERVINGALEEESIFFRGAFLFLVLPHLTGPLPEAGIRPVMGCWVAA